MYLYCASERAPQKHIFPGLQIHLHIQCHIQSMRFPLITYGMALYTHYTDKTLKLRNIYEYASERSERAKFFWTFSQSKTVISFIILLVLQILSLRNIYFQVSNNICLHNTQSMHFPYITYSMMLYINDSIPTKHLH